MLFSAGSRRYEIDTGFSGYKKVDEQISMADGTEKRDAI
jgi:predicted aspartyl protease